MMLKRCTRVRQQHQQQDPPQVTFRCCRAAAAAAAAPPDLRPSLSLFRCSLVAAALS